MARRDRVNVITKQIGIPLNISKGIEELVGDEAGQIIVNGFFTSDEKDEIGDIITKKATVNAIPKYREWGNIRYMHMPKPVAKVLAIGKDDGLKWNEVKIQVVDPEAVFQVRNGLLKALSVGIIIWSFDDIEIEDDGTWIINNYDLVEISLVDHPANYDAKLFLDDDKAINITNDVRQMVAAQGLAMVAKVLGSTVSPKDNTIQEESDMANVDKDLLQELEEVTTEEVEEVTEEIVPAEEIEVELDLEAEAVEEEIEVELSLDLTEEIVEEPVSDSEDLDISEEEVIEEDVTEVQQYTFAPETIQEIVNLVVKGLADALAEVSPEVPEETEEQVEVELVAEVDEPVQEDESTLEDAQAKIASLEAQIAELNAPDVREGRLNVGALPDEVVEEVGEEDKNNTSTNRGVLTDALKNYMSQSQVTVIRPRS